MEIQTCRNCGTPITGAVYLVPKQEGQYCSAECAGKRMAPPEFRNEYEPD